MKSAIFAAAFDSQLKWCATIRREFLDRGIECRIVVPSLRSALSSKQIQDVGIEGVERVSWNEMIDLAFSNDIFVSALSGPVTKRLSIEISSRTLAEGLRAPLLVAGWVGVIIEKLVAGYLDRCGCDIVAVNSKSDWDRFHVAAACLNIPTNNLLLTGLPFIPNTLAQPKSNLIQTVMFADQPTVPEAPHERLYIYRRLIEYAKAHPERKVILKPRHRPDEDTFHRMRYHPEDLLRSDVFPGNFFISYEPVANVVSQIDLMLTISSTAALEALAAGCRVGLLLDLGVHEKYGNQVFLESGLLRTFDAIAMDDIGAPDERWVAEFFPQLPKTPARIIADRAFELISSGTRPSRDAWKTSYFAGAIEVQLQSQILKAEIKAHAIPKLTPFQSRLQSYGPLRRAIVKAGDALLPSFIAKPIDKGLKRLGML